MCCDTGIPVSGIYGIISAFAIWSEWPQFMKEGGRNGKKGLL